MLEWLNYRLGIEMKYKDIILKHFPEIDEEDVFLLLEQLKNLINLLLKD